MTTPIYLDYNATTPAAQTIAKLAVRLPDLAVDLLTVAGHKCYAPEARANRCTVA